MSKVCHLCMWKRNIFLQRDIFIQNEYLYCKLLFI